MINVLFVCLGNICRSPTAEAVFRAQVRNARLGERIGVDSAGTHDYHTGKPPDPRAVAAALRRGLEMDDLRARVCKSDDFRRFDYILAMDRNNLADLVAIRPAGGRAHLALLLDFAPDADRSDVPDPYYADEDAFERMFELIEEGARGLLAHVQAEVR